jgi:hypothetical protein
MGFQQATMRRHTHLTGSDEFAIGQRQAAHRVQRPRAVRCRSSRIQPFEALNQGLCLGFALFAAALATGSRS